MKNICPECNRTLKQSGECEYCQSSHTKETSFLTSIFLTVTLMGIIVGGSIFFIKSVENPIDILRKFIPIRHVNKNYSVTKMSPNLPEFTEPVDTIDIDQIDALREMLKNQAYEELNLVLERYQNLFEKNNADEYKVFDAFQAFSLTNPSYEEFLITWVEEFPNDYQPHLATAHYYYTKGWKSRGFKFAKETSREQFQEMELNFSKAEEYIETALKINPQLMPAYKMQMGIHNANGDETKEDQIIEMTLKLFPSSYIMTATCLLVKNPRWGGSYQTMEDLAKNAEQHIDINPRLILLYGHIYEDQGRTCRSNENYTKADDYYTKALSIGEDWFVYKERASVRHYYLKEYEKALEDINRSIELYPVKHKSYLLRSKIFFTMKNFNSSLEDLKTARRLNPDDTKIIKFINWAGKNLSNKGHKVFKENLNSSIENYDLSLEFDPEQNETYYWRGRAYCKLREYDLALSDFKNSIELDPRHFDSYRMLDYILARDGQWDLIIEYWNKLISLEPQHADAYLERAGTYHHKGDDTKAAKDLKKSCDLGNKGACQRLRNMSSG